MQPTSKNIGSHLPEDTDPTHTYTPNTRSNVMQDIDDVLTVAIQHQKSVSSVAGHRLSLRDQVKQLRKLVMILENEAAWDVLYATHSLGMVWAGLINTIVPGHKNTLYNLLGELEWIGLLRKVPPKSPEIKERLAIEQSRKRNFRKGLVGDFYTVHEQYIDILSQLFSRHQDNITFQVRTEVGRVQRHIAAVKAQRDRFAQEMAEARKDLKPECKLHNCGREPVIEGWCMYHWEWQRNNPEEARKALEGKRR